MKKIVVIALIFGMLAGASIFGYRYEKQQEAQKIYKTQESKTIGPVIEKKNYFSHKGKNGKDALTLLKEQTKVEQDISGLVISINGTKTESSKKQYWAFYVNGKQAQVGPADYVTKDSDFIEWIIKTY